MSPGGTRIDRAQRRTVAAWLFYGTLLVYVLTAAYRQQSIDTISTYIPAWQLATHGNLTVDHFADPQLWFVHSHGRLVSNRFPGAVLFATPFYFLLDHSDRPLPLVGNLAAATATAAAVTALFLLLSRMANRRTALAGALLVAFGTPTWAVSGHALWTHGPAQLCLLLALLALASGHPLLAGLALGGAVLTRPHLVLVAAAVALALTWRHRSVRPALPLALGSGAGVIALLIYNRLLYGGWTVLGAYSSPAAGAGTSTVRSGLGGVGPVAFLQNIAGALVSPGRGVLVLTPFVLLLLPGLPAAWRSSPSWARQAAGGGLLYLAAQLWWDDFWGGYGFFSYRLPLETLTLAAPVLLLAYQGWTAQRPWRRRSFTALVAVSVGFQALGVTVPSNGWQPASVWTTFAPLSVWSTAGLGWVVVPLAAGVLVLGSTRRGGWLRGTGRGTACPADCAGLPYGEKAGSAHHPDDAPVRTIAVE